MCGIAGFFGTCDSKNLERAVECIKHRGPDDTGIDFIDSNIGMGHVRLSVLDTSFAGHQPMFTEDGSKCIVYNGEIYNFQELRKDLESSYTFKSNTDTEVLLYGYAKYGREIVSKINGMFSFVIYDQEKREFFGARDRLGKKPFKYYLGPKGFFFVQNSRDF